MRRSDLEAVDVGQADVEQHDVRVLRSTTSSAASPVAGAEDVDLAPLEGEPEADRLDDVGLVVDDQDPHHRRRPARGPAAGTASAERAALRRARLSTSIVPPCAWAIASAVGRPRPTPSRASRAVAAADEEALEQAGLVCLRDARPVVGAPIQRTSHRLVAASGR